ncbi:MAG: hypothetical protein ACLTDX_06170 [[Clostridium] innocuum]
MDYGPARFEERKWSHRINRLPCKHFYGGKAVIGKDSGNGTYEVTLTTNSGKTVTARRLSKSAGGISLPKPVIGVSGTAIAADAGKYVYTSGAWTDAKRKTEDITVKNPDVSGAVTYDIRRARQHVDSDSG